MSSTGDTKAGDPSVDLARLAQIFGEEDEAELFRFLGWFVDGFPELFGAVEDALEAKNPQMLEDAAHGAKSAAMNAAAPRLTALLRYIVQGSAGENWDALSEAVGQVREEFDRIGDSFCKMV